mgnify:CR=1 FL=1
MSNSRFLEFVCLPLYSQMCKNTQILGNPYSFPHSLTEKGKSDENLELMKEKILERISEMQNCLGMDFKISDVLNFTSSFWTQVKYQHEIDRMGRRHKRRSSAKSASTWTARSRKRTKTCVG